MRLVDGKLLRGNFGVREIPSKALKQDFVEDRTR